MDRTGTRLLAIIPAHNEADSIAGVIDDIRAHTGADIVVVNDGSTDRTPEIALEKGAELLNMPFNLGIGSTMQTGFKFAYGQGYDIAVQVDGDGQHDAAELPALIQPLLDGECDMVLGSRYLRETGYSGSAGRRVGTAIFSRILSLMLRQRLTDATSGFRAINGSVIELFAHDYPRDYPEVEALLQVHMARFRIREIPVRMRERGGGRSSINTFRSIYYMVKVLLALAVVMSRKKAPRVESAK
ncbi:MAG: glycosyltransferase family 2 protein [Gaiellales bacterium]|nr:MAG: glycosyltransferase family 2 protein [Gaiellales bacterium]